MKLTYDERGGAAYLRLRGDTDDVGTLSSKIVEPPSAEHMDDRMLLDFDEDGRLVGIEFLTPDDRLLPGVLASADRGR
jgi:uncharacterized protein YuzE